MGADLELRAVLKDFESGLTDDEIMLKHGLSKEQLEIVNRALDRTKRLTRRILANERSKRLGARGTLAEAQGNLSGAGMYVNSSFYKLYVQYNVPDGEIEEIENKLEPLRMAIRDGSIKPEEFDREIRTLVRNLIWKRVNPP